ncbi:hypothetical protein [Agrococcus sp. SGAir0287]|uniref:hypothetical protein n=1 Tax=Agrococcus sp. SGAir0287 TaxID=2070347 RepID=UPI0010CD05F6|nr:hypothetical protein [Agrococcus sp. SGAir0287]QCR20382.1 hypothetical protein C1N71_13795 [Agrococcus sp. SGAir0287]
MTGVREGSIADFQAAGLDQEFLDQLEGYQPLSVDVEVRQVAPMTAELADESVHTTCSIVATRGDEELAGATCGPYDTQDDEYAGEPLVWRP